MFNAVVVSDLYMLEYWYLTHGDTCRLGVDMVGNLMGYDEIVEAAQTHEEGYPKRYEPYSLYVLAGCSDAHCSWRGVLSITKWFLGSHKYPWL